MGHAVTLYLVNKTRKNISRKKLKFKTFFMFNSNLSSQCLYREGSFHQYTEALPIKVPPQLNCSILYCTSEIQKCLTVLTEWSALDSRFFYRPSSITSMLVETEGVSLRMSGLPYRGLVQSSNLVKLSIVDFRNFIVHVQLASGPLVHVRMSSY